MRLRTLALATGLALSASLLAVPAHASQSAQTPDSYSELATELAAIKEASLAAYGGQLVMRFNESIAGSGVVTIGTSLSGGPSMWGLDVDGNVLFAVGHAYDNQAYIAPGFSGSEEARKRMHAAAARAGITPTTLLHVQAKDYKFWDLEEFSAENVEEAATYLSPIAILDQILGWAGSPNATLTKATSGEDTEYTWKEADWPATATLVVRNGILIEARSETGPSTSTVLVTAYGEDAAPAALPGTIVEAETVATYFTSALSYDTRQYVRTALVSIANSASATLSTLNAKKITKEKIRSVLKRELRTITVNNLRWKATDTPRGIQASVSTVWGPISHTLTYDERNRRVTVSR